MRCKVTLLLLISLSAAIAVPVLAYDRVVQVYNIPKLANITIDGQADDWQDDGFQVNTLPLMGCGMRSVDNFDVQLRLGWNERGLLALITVRDDIGYEHEQIIAMYRNDSVQLYLADKRGGANMIAPTIGPGMDPRFPDIRVSTTDCRKTEALRKTPPVIEAAREKIPGGYRMEVCLPWDNLGLEPKSGMECGFNLYVNDCDQRYGDLNVAWWYPQPFSILNTTAMQSLRLAEKASDPVDVAAWMAYASDKPGNLRVQLAAPARYAGKKATVQAQGPIGAGTFELRDGRAVATIYVPTRTLAQRPRDVLTRILVDNIQVGTLDQQMLLPEAGSLLPFIKLGAKIPRTMQLLATSTPEKRHKVRILFYGQSITAQSWWWTVARELRERFPYADITVMNPAIGGYQVPMLLRTAEADVYPQYPDLIIFDAYYGFEGTLEQLVKNIRSRTTAEVMLQTHHLTTHGMTRIADNLTVRELAEKYGCELIDVSDQWTEFMFANGINGNDLLTDGPHLSEPALELMPQIVNQHFQYNPAFNNPWSSTVTAVTPRPDRTGRIKLNFDGNRVDLVAATPAAGMKLGSARILIDGKQPRTFPELYTVSRVGSSDKNYWTVPFIYRVSAAKPLIAEEWTLRITKTHTGVKLEDNFLEFEVEGSKTGKDGTGTNKSRFVSNSGRVVIEPQDWYSSQCTEGVAFTWKAIPQFIDVYRAPAIPDPSREYITTLFQGLAPGKHTLEIVPNGDGAMPIAEIRVHRPPLAQNAP